MTRKANEITRYKAVVLRDDEWPTFRRDEMIFASDFDAYVAEYEARAEKAEEAYEDERAMCEAAIYELDKVKAQRDALKRALIPFAEFADEYLGNQNMRGIPKKGEVYGIDFTGKGHKAITVEMLIAVRAALKEVER